jgi:hypothetical protein
LVAWSQINKILKKDNAMGITISKESLNCIVVTVTGVFLHKDLEAIQNSAKEMLNSISRVNCLILAKQFSGWGKDGDWGDLTFMYENDSSIGKIAVVAEEKRRDELLMFLGAGYRKATVKFFFPGDEDEARIWLSEPVATGR